MRRRVVLDAARACFGTKGVNGTSIEEICQQAKTSVGSVYHQFGSKTGIAAALYLDTLADYQRHISTAIEPDCTARAGIHALIAAHLAWVVDNPFQARFLQEFRRNDALAEHETEILNLNRQFGRAIATWAQTRIADHSLRPLPIDIFMSVLLGPANEYVRGLLEGRHSTPAHEAALLLGETTWRALCPPP